MAALRVDQIMMTNLDQEQLETIIEVGYTEIIILLVHSLETGFRDSSEILKLLKINDFNFYLYFKLFTFSNII